MPVGIENIDEESERAVNILLLTIDHAHTICMVCAVHSALYEVAYCSDLMAFVYLKVHITRESSC